MSCPDQDKWQLFLEQELSAEEEETLVAHLETCSQCLEVLKAMLAEEKVLIESLLHLREKTGLLPVSPTSTESCLPTETIMGYTQGSLVKQKDIEGHLLECDYCLKKLLQIQQTLILPEIPIDASTLLDQIKQEHLQKSVEKIEGPLLSVLEIVLRFTKELIEVIQHNGDLIVPKPIPITRGTKKTKEREPSKRESVTIRKDFKETGISVEVTVNKERKRRSGSLQVSIMQLATGEFSQGLTICLRKGEKTLEHLTDKDGLVSFLDIVPGEYTIEILAEHRRSLGQVVLVIQ